MSPMSQTSASVAGPPLWRNLSFHLLWSSTFASGVGDRLIMNAALPMLGYGREGVDNSGVASGIDFFFFLPYLVWAPVAGWLADRLPRKWLMFAADELRALIVLGAFLYMPGGSYFVPEDQHWKVWLTIGLVGVMAATFVPAKLSIVPNVVGFASLTRANAAVVSMGIIGNLIGFIVGGLIVEESVAAMVLMSSVFYGVSGWFWAFLKTPYRADAPGVGGIEATGTTPLEALRDIARGLRYAWDHRVVRLLILTAALVWTGTAIYMPALAVVNVDVYGGTAADFMFVAAPIGLGMLLGAAALGFINPRLGNELLIAAGLAGCGLFIGLQMIVPIYAAGLAIALFTGISASVLLVPVYTLMQRTTADHIRGRVFAAKEILTEAGKVVIAGLVWQMPGTDPYMRPAAGGLALVLIAAAIYGTWRFILVGPAPTRSLNFLWRLCRFLADGMHNLKWRGRHRVPRDRGVLLVSNHRSGIDPLLIQAALPRVIRWMMTHEYHVRALGWLWKRIKPIPVKARDGRDSVGEAIAELKRGGIVGIFPEGGINRTADQPLLRLHPGVVLLARRSEALIVPVWVQGPPVLKSPLLAYLKPSQSRVTFGEPFVLKREAGDRAEAIEVVRRKLLELAEQAGAGEGSSTSTSTSTNA